MAIEHVDDHQFAEKTKSGRVLLDFYAEWCGPCKRLTPILEELAPEVADKCQILKVNIDDCGAICSRFGLTSVPTLILLQDGKEAGRMIGLRSKDEVRQFIAS